MMGEAIFILCCHCSNENIHFFTPQRDSSSWTSYISSCLASESQIQLCGSLNYECYMNWISNMKRDLFHKSVLEKCSLRKATRSPRRVSGTILSRRLVWLWSISRCSALSSILLYTCKTLICVHWTPLHFYKSNIVHLLGRNTPSTSSTH